MVQAKIEGSPPLGVVPSVSQRRLVSGEVVTETDFLGLTTNIFLPMVGVAVTAGPSGHDLLAAFSVNDLRGRLYSLGAR